MVSSAKVHMNMDNLCRWILSSAKIHMNMYNLYTHTYEHVMNKADGWFHLQKFIWTFITFADAYFHLQRIIWTCIQFTLKHMNILSILQMDGFICKSSCSCSYMFMFKFIHVQMNMYNLCRFILSSAKIHRNMYNVYTNTYEHILNIADWYFHLQNCICTCITFADGYFHLQIFIWTYEHV